MQQAFIETYYQERKQTNSLKWDALKERYGDETLLPLWVADMDFSVPTSVKEALHQRIEHGIFGYSTLPTDYFATYQGWQERHAQTQYRPEWLFFSTGVVQSLYDLIDCFTEVGDSVLIQTPVYYPFYHSIQDKHRQLVTNDLKKCGDHYEMDLVDFEEKIREHSVKLFILCSPHNPVGRVWTEGELAAVLAICQKYQVLVLADEIHSDIILPGFKFTSAISVSAGRFHENLIVCNAPSKTFNLATLLNSHVWIPSKTLRQHYQAWVKQHKQTEHSSLGQLAAQTAYATGDEWLDQVLEIVQENAAYIQDRLARNLPMVTTTKLEGTYLLWLDLSALPITDFKEFIQGEAKLAIDYGEWFAPQTDRYIRLNLATKPANIQLALDRLIIASQKIVTREEEAV